MQISSWVAAAVAAGCLGHEPAPAQQVIPPGSRPDGRAPVAQEARTPAVESAFPTPTKPLTLAPGEGATYEGLFQAFVESTGLNVVVSADDRARLSRTPIEVFGELALPPEEIYPVVESMLAAQSFAMVEIGNGRPYVYRLLSLEGQQGGSARLDARFVDPGALVEYRDHPAVLISTTLIFEHVDTRQLTNSLRPMLTDSRTQVAIPVGNTNALILQGPGRFVASMAEQFEQIDAAEGRRYAKVRAAQEEEAARQKAQSQKSSESEGSQDTRSGAGGR